MEHMQMVPPDLLGHHQGAGHSLDAMRHTLLLLPLPLYFLQRRIQNSEEKWRYEFWHLLLF